MPIVSVLTNQFVSNLSTNLMLVVFPIRVQIIVCAILFWQFFMTIFEPPPSQRVPFTSKKKMFHFRQNKPNNFVKKIRRAPYFRWLNLIWFARCWRWFVSKQNCVCPIIYPNHLLYKANSDFCANFRTKIMFNRVMNFCYGIYIPADNFRFINFN